MVERKKNFVYHIVTHKSWKAALQAKKYNPASLAAEGFIHASWLDQVLGSAEKHYQDEDSLVLLQIPTKKVKAILKEEEGRDKDLFPHLYGNFHMNDVVNLMLIVRNAKGAFEIED